MIDEKSTPHWKDYYSDKLHKEIKSTRSMLNIAKKQGRVDASKRYEEQLNTLLRKRLENEIKRKTEILEKGEPLI